MKRKANGSASNALTEPSSPAEILREHSTRSVLSAGPILQERIDVKKLVDEAWLRDPENRAIADRWLKFLAMQQSWATALLNTQVKVDEKTFDSAGELRAQQRAEALREMARQVAEHRE